MRTPFWRRALRHAVPLLAVLWLASAAGLGWIWPARQVEVAIAALSARGFTVAGNTREGFRINSGGLEEGALAELGQRLRTLQPLLSLTTLFAEESSMPALAGLSGLQQLKITNNDRLQTLPSLAGLSELQQLSITNNHKLKSLPSLAGLSGLQQLSITGNVGLKSLPGLSTLERLEGVVIEGPLSLAVLPELMRLPHLGILVLSDEAEIAAKVTALAEERRVAGLMPIEVRHLSGDDPPWDWDPFR
jgi:hypothetical protein